MTEQQALAKARRIWKRGYVRAHREASIFRIGYVMEAMPGFPLFSVEGEGSNWEEAFEKAAAKKAEDAARAGRIRKRLATVPPVPPYKG